MLRVQKKYTVHDLLTLKGKRCLSHIHIKSPEEAAAAADMDQTAKEKARLATDQGPLLPGPAHTTDE